jgi:hypothetical protein
MIGIYFTFVNGKGYEPNKSMDNSGLYASRLLELPSRSKTSVHPSPPAGLLWLLSPQNKILFIDFH